MERGILTFPKGVKRHITAPDLLINITNMYTTEDRCHDAFIEQCDKIITLHDNLIEKTKMAAVAGTKMAEKVTSKLFGEHAYSGGNSYVDEEDMDYADTDDIDMPHSTESQLQLMPSSSSQDNNQIFIPNVQPKSERTVHMKGKKDCDFGSPNNLKVPCDRNVTSTMLLIRMNQLVLELKALEVIKEVRLVSFTRLMYRVYLYLLQAS